MRYCRYQAGNMAAREMKSHYACIAGILCFNNVCNTHSIPEKKNHDDQYNPVLRDTVRIPSRDLRSS